MSEYNNSFGGSSCNYGKLCAYDAGYGMGVAQPNKATTVIVPQFGGISYETVKATPPNCMGYSNMDNAYGKSASNCQSTFKTALCRNGGCGN